MAQGVTIVAGLFAVAAIIGHVSDTAKETRKLVRGND
jgi:hypothetical protein